MFPIQTEIAWAAGFFDGEGCVYVSGMEYRVAINQVDRRPLDRFVKALGRGKVTGPYSKKNPKHKEIFALTYTSASARFVLQTLWPYLSEPKKEQAHRQWAKRDERERVFRLRSETTRGPKGHLVSLAIADLEMCST